MPDVIDRWAPRGLRPADRLALLWPTPAAPPARARGWRRRGLRLLRALPATLAVLVVAGRGLGNRAMWSDEYATWYASTLSRADFVALIGHVDAVIAPYYLFLRGWIAVFGDSAAALRMPSLIGMAVAAGLVTILGEQLVHAWVGIGAGLVFAALPEVSRYAQEARPYGLAVAAAVLATIALLRALEQPHWSRWWWYGGGLLVTGLAHVVALLILLPHLVAFVAAARGARDFRFWRWLAPVLAVGTVLLPLLAKGSSESDAIGWIRANGQAVAQLPGKMAGSSGTATIVAALAAIGLVTLVRFDRSVGWTLLTWALGPVAFCYLTFPVLHLFLYRYLLFTLPAWCLLAGTAGYGLVRWIVGSSRRWITATATALVTAVVVGACAYAGVPGQVVARQSPVVGEPDFRAAAGVVRAQLEPGDGIAYAALTRNGRRAMAYELRGATAPRDTFLSTPSQQLGTFGATECSEPGRCARDTPRIWLVVVSTEGAGDPFVDMPPAIARLLRDEFATQQRWRLAGVAVYLLNRVS